MISTKKCKLELISYLCQVHPFWVADILFKRIVDYLLLRLKDIDGVVHTSSASTCGILSLFVLPHTAPKSSMETFQISFIEQMVQESPVDIISRTGAALCLSAILRPPFLEMSLEIITPSHDVTSMDVGALFKACELYHISFTLHENKISIHSSLERIVEIHKQLSHAQAFPGDWTLVFVSKEDDDEISSDVPQHIRRLHPCFEKLLVSVMTAIKRYQGMKEMEAPLLVAIACAAIAKVSKRFYGLLNIIY